MKGSNVDFPCGLVRYTSEPGRFMNEDILEYQGTFYTLSETRMPFKADKTVDEDYFILKMCIRDRGLLDEQEYLTLKEHYVQEKEKLEYGINQAQARKRMVEKSIDDFLEIEKNLEQYLDDRSFNQKLIDELVDKIYVSSKGMIEVRMKCSDVFQKVMEIME